MDFMHAYMPHRAQHTLRGMHCMGCAALFNTCAALRPQVASPALVVWGGGQVLIFQRGLWGQDAAAELARHACKAAIRPHPHAPLLVPVEHLRNLSATHPAAGS